MDLHDLTPVLTADGPFVTVHVDAESAVEQGEDRYDLQWKNALRELADKGVDGATREAVSAARGRHADGASRLVIATAADVQLVPHELSTAPRGGVGAVLRYADALDSAVQQ